MAVAGCMWARPADAERFWTDVQQDYRAVGFEGSPPSPPEQIGVRHFPPEAASFFEETASLRYPFQVRYSADDYLANLATQSGTHALGKGPKRRLPRPRKAQAGVAWPAPADRHLRWPSHCRQAT